MRYKELGEETAAESCPRGLENLWLHSVRHIGLCESVGYLGSKGTT